MFKFFPWDVQAATAIAVVAIFLVAIFNLSPLLLIVIFFALCAYIAAQSVLDKHKQEFYCWRAHSISCRPLCCWWGVSAVA